MLPRLMITSTRGADALEQLGKVITTNDYGLVVLLQHDGFPPPETLEQLRKCCPSTTILPGAEINVFVGVLNKKVSKDHFFHCLVIADADLPQEPGSLIYVAKQNLTYRDDQSP
ncbi:hypothetical protein ACFL5Q_07520, partial [Planctomycetota bacterium]